MYLQTVMLLRERGLDSFARRCWSLYHQTVDAFVGAPEEWMLFCGMSIATPTPMLP